MTPRDADAIPILPSGLDIAAIRKAIDYVERQLVDSE